MCSWKPAGAPARRAFASVDVLGVRIDDVTWDEALEAFAHFVCQGGAHQIATVNTEYLMAARRDPEFAAILHHTDLNVPDSVGVLAAARWLGHPLRERVSGSDGIYRVAGLCANWGFRLFLLGAAPGVAERVARILAARYPGLQICGTRAGSPFSGEADAIAAHVRRSRADVLLVAYPYLAQEKWIACNQARTGAAVAMGVGGTFDFVAGVQKRAPRWIRCAGLEWLYRLIRQPWRWRRMLALPHAAWLVFWQRFHISTRNVRANRAVRPNAIRTKK